MEEREMASVTLRTGGERTHAPLPEDTYLMRVREASVVQSRRGEDQLLLVWEIAELTAEQEAAGIDPDRWVRQWLSLFYGETQAGASRLKRLIDGLQRQGLLQEFDPAAARIDTDWFVGIEQRVTVAVDGRYNRVVMISPPRQRSSGGPRVGEHILGVEAAARLRLTLERLAATMPRGIRLERCDADGEPRAHGSYVRAVGREGISGPARAGDAADLAGLLRGDIDDIARVHALAG